MVTDKTMASYSSSDLVRANEDFKNLILYAENKIESLRKTRNSFQDRGSSGLWQDSKVPEAEKNMCNFLFSNVSRVEKQDVLQMIDKYLDLYEKLNCTNDVKDLGRAYYKMQELHKNIKDMIETASSGVRTTNSKTLYNLHQDFLAEEKLIEKKLEKAKHVVCKELSNCYTMYKQENSRLIETLTENNLQHNNLIREYNKINSMYLRSEQAVKDSNETMRQWRSQISNNFN